jgi:prevent-host-death family protein
MTTITARDLRDELASYLHRVEAGERFVVLDEGKPVAALVALAELTAEEDADRLARLEARGLVVRPRPQGAPRFQVQIPARGKPASEMVIEDRR